MEPFDAVTTTTIDATAISDQDYQSNNKKAKHNTIEIEECDGFVFTCSLCDYYTEDKSTFDVHMKDYHVEINEKKFNCDMCHKKFKSNADLEEHKLSHAGDKPFVCNICGKAFARSFHLKVHNRLHTGERPYKCDICQRTFIDSSALSGHLKTHNEDKPHKCNECGRGFKDRGN